MFICLNYESNYLRLSSWKKKQPEFFLQEALVFFILLHFLFFSGEQNTILKVNCMGKRVMEGHCGSASSK